MAKAPSAPKTKTAAQSVAALRDEVAQALADGVAADDMTLHLTLGDASNMRRDRSIPIEDISFSDGEMRLLGVKVQSGGILQSGLERPAA